MSHSRLLALGLLSTLAAAGAIAYIWYTPVPEPDSLVAEPTKSTASLNNHPTSNSGYPLPPASLPIAPTQAPAPSHTQSPSIRLPLTPEPVTAQTLQDELLEQAKWLERAFPNRFEALNTCAQVYFFIKNTEKASELWRRSLELNRNHLEAHVGLAKVARETGKFEEAISRLKEPHDKDIVSAESLHLLVSLLEQTGELDLAKEQIRLATSKFPDSVDLLVLDGQISNQMDEFAESETKLKMALGKGASPRSVYPALIQSLSRQGKNEEAADLRTKLAEALKSPIRERDGPNTDYNATFALSLRDVAAQFYFQFAALERGSGNLSDTQRHLIRSLSLNPESPQTLFALGDLFHKQGKLAESIDVYKRLVQLEPNNLINSINLASLAVQADNISLAESTLIPATELPDGYLAQALLVRVYLGTGKFQQARSLMDKVLERSQSVDAHILNSMVHKAMGENIAARAAIVRAKEIAPNDPRLQPGSPYVNF